MKKWIKLILSILVILFACAIVATGENLVYKAVSATICGVCIWLFLFLLWLPEQRKRWNSREYKAKEKAKWEHKVPNPWLNKILVKENWMDNVYNEICLEYLNKKYDHTIPMMEKVLFLMHHESLLDLQRPLIRKKVYIDGTRVRITFLSDRFRVKELSEVGMSRGSIFSGRYAPNYWQYMGVYKIMLKNYMKYDEATLDSMMENCMSKPLPKHTYKKIYKSWFHRYMARTESHRYAMKETIGRTILTILGGFADIIAFTSAALLPFFLLNEIFQFNTLESGMEHENLFIWFLILCIGLPRVVYCYRRYNKPTTFELEYKKLYGDE